MAWKRLFILAATLLLTLVCQAETSYVSDKIAVALLSKKDTNSKLIKALPSGTALEVLETAGDFARVREPEGAEGWVETRYLTTEKPVRVQLEELHAKQEGTEEELTAAREALDTAQARLASMAEHSANRSAASSAVDEAALGSLRREREMLRERIDGAIGALQGTSAAPCGGESGESATPALTTDITLPWQWLLGGALCILLAGFLWGAYWLDQRHRRRHGGFRL